MSLDSTVNVRAFKDIPGPATHWLLGNIGQFEKNLFHHFCYQQVQDFGPISKIRFMHKTILIVSRAETVQTLLKDRPEGFRRSSTLAGIFKDIGIEGTFTTEGQQWQRQRRLINPAFAPTKLKNFYSTLQTITQRLCHVIEEHQGQALEMQQLFMRYTVDVTSSLAFGDDINTLENSELELQQHLNRVFPMISSRLRSGFPYWRYFKKQKDRELDNSLRFIKTQVNHFIAKAEQRLQDRAQQQGIEISAVEAQDVLETMIQSRDEAGNTYTNEELFSNVMILLLAGEDTTANTLAWTIDRLADHLTVQDAIFNEIQANYPSSGELSLEDLDNFPLTFAAAQEAMRLKPVLPYTFLESNKDTEIEGYHIPEGTSMLVLLAHDAYNAELFPNPEQFNVERWLNISDQQRKTYAQHLMHFGFGPRLCPGRQLAFMEMKIALIEMLKRYRFSREGEQVAAKDVKAVTVAPDKVDVMVTRR